MNCGELAVKTLDGPLGHTLPEIFLRLGSKESCILRAGFHPVIRKRLIMAVHVVYDDVYFGYRRMELPVQILIRRRNPQHDLIPPAETPGSPRALSFQKLSKSLFK